MSNDCFISKSAKWNFLTHAPMVMLLTLATVFISGPSAGYDYSEPMQSVQGLPLDNVEMPFVLRFTREELLSEPIWTKRVDGIVIPSAADSPIRIGAEALRATLLKHHHGEAPLIECDATQAELPQTLEGKCFTCRTIAKHLAAFIGHLKHNHF